MKNKIFWTIICLLIVLILIQIHYISLNSKNFRNLIKYKSDSIYNENKLKKILSKIEFDNYLINIKKEKKGSEEHITLFYDCSDEDEILNYYRNYHKISIVEKNAVILFSLINNLNEITFNFNVSNIEFAKEHHLPILNDKFDLTKYTYTREDIEKLYNQDVRNYITKPNTFMDYNIDLNVDSLTIYYRQDSNNDNYNIIHLSEQNKIETIVRFIKEHNFDVPDGGYNGVCNIWLDLNNGFIIGIYGHSYNNYGCIINGISKEVFTNGNINFEDSLNIVYKLLPIGLTEYIENIIENN